MKKKGRLLSIVVLQLVLIALVPLIVGNLSTMVSAQVYAETTDSTSIGILALASAIAITGSSLAAGMAIKSVGSAAISSLMEREDTFFKAFLVIALGEALAIYGLIVAILLWIKIP